MWMSFLLSMRNKKGSILDHLKELIIAVIIIVVAVIGMLILTGKGNAALEVIKRIMRFGRV